MTAPASLGVMHMALRISDTLVEKAGDHVKALIDGRGEAGLNEHQTVAHAFAQFATSVAAGKELVNWVERLDAREGSLEADIAAAWIARTLVTLPGGIALSAAELAPLSDLGIDIEYWVEATRPIADWLKRTGGVEADARIAARLETYGTGSPGLDDTLDQIRQQFRRFSVERVIPNAQQWHRTNSLIPLEIIKELADLGVFGLTTPEAYGGSGLGKFAMVIVTEELSRGYIGVGSLGTRSEIAAELINAHGTDEQKREWLPKIATAEVLPTAAFTEPNFGSDLANASTRAEKVDGGWRIYGQKTWMTHGSRSDVMTLLVRTDPATPGHRGLSMFLASKTRGDDNNLFPDEGMDGGEIHVLGYRGMREYDVAFDGFFVPDSALLGGKPGTGFKQLMATMETARIQTAARGVGVAQSALDEGIRYATSRIQFGKPIFSFPRISGKLARGAVSIQAARQLAYAAARAKEEGRRCDLEAGMAKLLATRAAFEVADAAVQVHGGMGFGEETTASRIFVDSRVLSIFEGTNEIQAQIIARRLLE